MSSFRWVTAGESHGQGLSTIVEGVPAGLPLTEHYIHRDLARYVAERVSQRTRDARQAIHVAQLCDTKEEVDRFESGAEPGRIL
jgi:chorismate synthase